VLSPTGQARARIHTWHGGFRGEYGGDVAFRLFEDASGQWSERVLHAFGSPGDGIKPQAAYGGLLIFSGRQLYGTTLYGRASGNGIIFPLAPSDQPDTPWNEVVLYNFTGGSDGGNPTTGLTAGSDGTLYGTTSTGAQGGGTVFSLTPPASTAAAWTLAVLYTFGKSKVFPSTLLLNASSQALYGTTNAAGKAGDGTIFVLRPPAVAGGAWQYSTVQTFSGPDGANPSRFGRGPRRSAVRYDRSRRKRKFRNRVSASPIAAAIKTRPHCSAAC